MLDKLPPFPVVVKPALSKTNVGDEILSAGVMYAKDLDELLHLYATVQILRYPSLIQEMITGEGTGLFTLFDKNKHLALFSHRRLLEKPPSGGVSVMSESIPLDQEMVDSASKLLSAVGWTGVAMVEFKRDIRDNKPKLMEINGRFWGSLQLAVASGVDFPSLFVDYCQGRSPQIIDHLLIRAKEGFFSAKPYICLPPYHDVFVALFSIGRGVTSDVYDSRDIGPFLKEIRLYIKALLS